MRRPAPPGSWWNRATTGTTRVATIWPPIPGRSCSVSTRTNPTHCSAWRRSIWRRGASPRRASACSNWKARIRSRRRRSACAWRSARAVAAARAKIPICAMHVVLPLPGAMWKRRAVTKPPSPASRRRRTWRWSITNRWLARPPVGSAPAMACDACNPATRTIRPCSWRWRRCSVTANLPAAMASRNCARLPSARTWVGRHAAAGARRCCGSTPAWPMRRCTKRFLPVPRTMPK